MKRLETVILDLEWNTAYFKSKNGFANEIIEIGAVKLDDSLRVIDSFSTLIAPGKNHNLRSSVKKMTNLSNEELRASGVPFSKGIQLFGEWVEGCVIGTWSRSDVYALIENCRIFLGRETIPFLKRYIDIQDYVQRQMVPRRNTQISLQSAAEAYEVDFEEKSLHRALNDSKITAEILKKCYNEERFLRMISNADERFYERLFFKPYIINDIKSKYIDARDFDFNCENCRARLKKRGRWQYKDKAFNASFYCKVCDAAYSGRVQVKKTYDSVQVKKTLTKKPVETSKRPDRQAVER